MQAVYFSLLFLSVIMFALSAVGTNSPRISFLALGLLCWVLVPFLKALQKL